jgi:hypothetical protein
MRISIEIIQASRWETSYTITINCTNIYMFEKKFPLYKLEAIVFLAQLIVHYTHLDANVFLAQLAKLQH